MYQIRKKCFKKTFFFIFFSKLEERYLIVSWQAKRIFYLSSWGDMCVNISFWPWNLKKNIFVFNLHFLNPDTIQLTGVRATRLTTNPVIDWLIDGLMKCFFQTGNCSATVDWGEGYKTYRKFSNWLIDWLIDWWNVFFQTGNCSATVDWCES